jgi:E3 ubiquitin-protein ligase NEDD4
MATQIVGYKPPPGSSERPKVVRLKVIRAQNLAKKDIFGASDPYVRIDLVTSQGDEVIDSVLTKTKKRTLNPRWEEEFLLRLKPAEHKIILEVFDENRLTRDDFLGRVEIDKLNTQGLIPKERTGVTNNYKSYILQPRSARSKVRGFLLLYLAYIEETTPPEEGGTHSDTEQAEESEPGWEMLEGGVAGAAAAAAAGTPATPAAAAETETGLDASAAVDEAESQTSPLPAGWEERQDANGRTYYVNHIARTTQWQRPGTAEDDVAVLAAAMESTATIQARENRNRRHHMVDDRSSNRDSVIEGSSSAGSLTRDDSTGGITGGSSTEGEQPPSQPPPPSSGPRSRTTSESDVTDNSTRRSGSTSGVSGSAGKNLDAVGLPSGWTLQVAPNGRVFFINHIAKKTTWIDPRNARPSPLPSQTNLPNRKQDDLGVLPEGWEERVHTDGRIFFIDHNTRITQWEDPRISNPQIAGQAVPYSRDYKRKYEYLRAQLKKPSNVPNKIEIKVKRSQILEDSYRQIHSIPSNKVDTLKTKLWIEFETEVGLDYGGVAREWFYLLSKEMFNPYYGLFEYSATDNYTLQINPNSGVCNEDHLSYFKFIGRVAGMAVFHGKLLDGFFIRPFYKMMLGKQIELKDMESVDTEYYNSLLWIKENDPAELDLPFQIDEESFGQTVSIELRPGGKEIKVTDENKDEYIQRVIEWRFINRVKKQMDQFLSGFNELVPLNLLKIFDEGELELLMCGIGSIDVKDWKKNTTYKGDYHPNHIVIQWFWRVVLSFNNEMRSRLLQFVTGTSRVPMNGFKELYGSNGPQLFTIEKWGSPTSYPRAHTCFNRLDLPPYESYQQLRDKLVKAIEGSEGFAGVD